MYPPRHDKLRMNREKCDDETCMKEVSPTRRLTYSRRLYTEVSRDHIASSSIFKKHQSSRSMIRKCRKSRLPRECQSPIMPYVFLSHVLNHTQAQPRVTIVTRREDYLQSSISHGIRSTDFPRVP